MKKSRILASFLALTMAAGLAACGGSSSAPATTAAPAAPAETQAAAAETTAAETKADSNEAAAAKEASGAEHDKETIKYLLSYEPQGVQPGSASKGVDFTVSGNLYDTLIREQPDDRSAFREGLATEWEYNEDGTELTFTIRDGVKFHDGSDMTLDDVIFSLEYDVAQAPNAAAQPVIKEIKASGDNQITVVCNYAYKPLLNLFATPGFGIFSKAFYEKCEADGTNFARVECGTGPYVLDEWVSGTSLTMHAFDEWWGGTPEIKNINWEIAQDSTTGALMMENNQADIYEFPSGNDYERLDALDNVAINWAPSAFIYYMIFNTKKAPFDDPKVREAISYAFDRESILEGGNAGIGQVVPFPVAPGFFGYDPDFEANPYDPDKAIEMLEEAGYPEGSINCTMVTSTETWYSYRAQVAQACLQDIGINCEIEILEPAAFKEQVLTKKDFELSFYNSGAPISDADPILWGNYHSTGAYNLAGINDPEVDALLETARQSLDDAERADCYRQIAEKNKENNWYLYSDVGYNAIAYNEDLTGGFYTCNNYAVYNNICDMHWK